MKSVIYNFLCKCKRLITYVSVMWMFLIVGISISTSGSSLKSSDKELKFPSAAQQATIDRWRDMGIQYSKIPAEVEEVKVKKEKLSDVHNLVSDVFLSARQPHLIGGNTQIWNNEIEDPLTRIDRMLTKLELITNNIETLQKDVNNPMQDVNNPMQDAMQELDRICNNLNRFFYVGTRSVQTDPSRVEILDPLGRHAPTRLQIGDWRHTVSLPCIPKTLVIKLGSLPLDLLEERISSSNPMKPFITSLVQNTTIGLFFDRRLTSRGDNPRSEVMFRRTQLEQVHHILMLERLETIYENYEPEQIAIMVRNLLHPNAAPVDMLPVDMLGVNDLEVIAVRSMIRGLMLPKHRYGVIPRLTKTENRRAVDMFRILSTNAGILLQFNPLHPAFLVIKQEALYTKYIQKRVDICCRFTRTNVMTTSMVEGKVNISGVTFDLLRTLISRIPLVKGASPMVNRLTLLAEKHVPVEVLCQMGHQYSATTNFNLEQEHLRNEALANFNDEIFRANYDVHTRDMSAQVTPFRAFCRQEHTFQMNEIHSRNFYDFRFQMTIDFDLFAELVKMTGPKQT